MFEERATGKYIMTHIFCDGEEMTPSEVVGLLNTLHQENQELQKKVKDWKFINDFQEKEIDGLKELLKEKEYVEEENEQLKKKIKPSIYNKKDGDWKWNVDNNTILNIRTGEIFYLRNSGAVENLVHLLNKLEQILSENEKMLQKDLDMLTELRRENEQLKKQLELRTESDKYHQRMLLKWLCIDEDEE